MINYHLGAWDPRPKGWGVARELELPLRSDAMTTIRKDGVFGPMSGVLKTLTNLPERFDFAVMSVC
jgi:hypothetical protein